MSDIPCDLLWEILVWVPAKSLLRVPAVCKEWRRLIGDPSFIKSHTNNQLKLSTTLLIRAYSDAPHVAALYSFSLDSLNFTDDCQTIDPTPVEEFIRRDATWFPISIVNPHSCNGLILVPPFFIRDKNWRIWNPLTRKYYEFSSPDVAGNGMSYSELCGFGYDNAADDYKVVSISHTTHSLARIDEHKTQIYSLKSDSWRTIRDLPYRTFNSLEGVFLNGCLHWETKDRIIVLDLGTGDQHQLSLPPMPTRKDLFMVSLEALGGYLFLSYNDRKRMHIEGWVMNDYGVEKSWSKLYSIKNQDVINARARPVAYLKREKHVLMQYLKGFFWVDIKNGSVKKVSVNGVSRIVSARLYAGSLISPGYT